MTAWAYRLSAQGPYLGLAQLNVLGVPEGVNYNTYRIGPAEFVVTGTSETLPGPLSIEGRTSVSSPLTSDQVASLVGD